MRSLSWTIPSWKRHTPTQRPDLHALGPQPGPLYQGPKLREPALPGRGTGPANCHRTHRKNGSRLGRQSAENQGQEHIHQERVPAGHDARGSTACGLPLPAADSWYASAENLNAALDLGHDFVMALESSRTAALSEAARAAGQFHAVSTLVFPDEQPLRAFCGLSSQRYSSPDKSLRTRTVRRACHT